MTEPEPHDWPDDVDDVEVDWPEPDPDVDVTALRMRAQQIAKHPHLTDGDLDELAVRLADLDEAVENVATARATLAAALAESMTADEEPIAGLGVVSREGTRSTSWDTKAARSAIRDRIVESIGEGDPATEAIVASTIDCVLSALGGSPKATGMTKLGLDPDEYRAITPTGWRVKLLRVEGLNTNNAPQEDRW